MKHSAELRRHIAKLMQMEEDARDWVMEHGSTAAASIIMNLNERH